MKKKAISVMLITAVLLLPSCSKSSSETTIDDDPIEVSVDIEETSTTPPETTKPVETMAPDISDSIETIETGSHASEIENAVLPAPYADLVDKATDFLNDPDDESELPEGFMGLLEVKHLIPREDLFSNVGYTCIDIDGNGTRELMFLAFDGDKKDVPRIVALFAIDESGRAIVLSEGIVRDRYELLSNGDILNIGSSGAAYTVFRVLRISADGMSLDNVDVFFTEEDENGDVCWFKSLDGKVYDECTLRDNMGTDFKPEAEDDPVVFKQGDFSLFENKDTEEVESNEED